MGGHALIDDFEAGRHGHVFPPERFGIDVDLRRGLGVSGFGGV